MLSIAICTHNRACQLRVLLENLSKLAPKSAGISQIILVDNGSTDETPALTKLYRERLSLDYFHEAKLGLSHARNRALMEFNGDAIWFLDDDTVISQQTVHAFIAALDEFKQQGYFGGPVQVDWQGHRPAWLKKDTPALLRGLFGEYDHGPDNVIYSERTSAPYGANMVLRRELIEAVGMFDPSFGLRGNDIGRGEESNYFARAEEQGHSGVYIAKAIVGHRFQQDRINLGYLWRYGIEKGRAEVKLHGHVRRQWFKQAARQFGLGLIQLCRGRRDHFYQCWINIGIARGRYLASQERATVNKSLG